MLCTEVEEVKEDEALRFVRGLNERRPCYSWDVALLSADINFGKMVVFMGDDAAETHITLVCTRRG